MIPITAGTDITGYSRLSRILSSLKFAAGLLATVLLVMPATMLGTCGMHRSTTPSHCPMMSLHATLSTMLGAHPAGPCCHASTYKPAAVTLTQVAGGNGVEGPSSNLALLVALGPAHGGPADWHLRARCPSSQSLFCVLVI